MIGLLAVLTLLAGCSSEPPAPAAPARPLTPPGPTGDPRIAMTQAMDLALAQPSVEDLWPDRAYRVDLRDEPGAAGAGAGRATLGLLDLDRDGRFDQRWTRDAAGALLVARSPDDDGRYGPPEPWDGPTMPGRLPLAGSAPAR